MKGLVTKNTYMQYESPITCGKKVMAKVKVFVHASHADPDTRAMTLAPRLAKNWPVFFDETFHNIYERMAILNAATLCIYVILFIWLPKQDTFEKDVYSGKVITTTTTRIDP